MKLGSHNSWSYLTPKKWWMKLLRFTAKCQRVNIIEQYEKYGVRCFDLRLNFKEGIYNVNHGDIFYDVCQDDIINDLMYLDKKGDCYVRMILDVRRAKNYDFIQTSEFEYYCRLYAHMFKNIKFFGGENLYNGDIEYDFHNDIISLDYYSSVRPPKIIDDWFPKLYAVLHNRKIKEIYKIDTAKSEDDNKVLLIDYVDIP